jgi:hypothetical protein
VTTRTPAGSTAASTSARRRAPSFARRPRARSASRAAFLQAGGPSRSGPTTASPSRSSTSARIRSRAERCWGRAMPSGRWATEPSLSSISASALRTTRTATSIRSACYPLPLRLPRSLRNPSPRRIPFRPQAPIRTSTWPHRSCTRRRRPRTEEPRSHPPQRARPANALSGRRRLEAAAGRRRRRGFATWLPRGAPVPPQPIRASFAPRGRPPNLRPPRAEACAWPALLRSAGWGCACSGSEPG